VNTDTLRIVRATREGTNTQQVPVHAFLNLNAVRNDRPPVRRIVASVVKRDDEVVVATWVVPDLFADCLVRGALFRDAARMAMDISA
jgi:hypothetical protein